MVKYIILGVVCILCGYIGHGFSSYYTNRSKFFKSLELLFDKLKTEISFSHNKLIQILSGNHLPSKDAQKLVKNFTDCLSFDLEISKENLFKDIKILTEDEKTILEIFLKSLGKFDAFNQTNQLSAQRQELTNLYHTATEQAKKYAPLYTKLGIILGLAIVLIFA